MATEFDDKDVKNALQSWRESAEKQAERPEWFWARQRARIASGMHEPKLQRMPVMAWAGIAATVALGVALMAGNKPAGMVPIRQQEPPKIVMTDQELMSELENTMNSGVPEALQPASTLVDEMERAQNARTSSKVKEKVQ